MNVIVLAALLSGDQFEKLDYRVSQLEARVSAVEAKLGIAPSAKTPTPTVKQSLTTEPNPSLSWPNWPPFMVDGKVMTGTDFAASQGGCSNGSCGMPVQGRFVQGGVMYDPDGIPVGGLYGRSASEGSSCGPNGCGPQRRGLFGRRR